ncbi:MAG: sugar phosphate isomerase/epimerase [Gammaproteobacteria bacterium]|nr:sugar phosphate isomerase/epimerase [Gammaproteobacteria bacterium]
MSDILNKHSRRNFLQSTATLGLATTVPWSVSSAQSRRVASVGLQLYSLRNEMSRDFAGTLARVAELGFKEMEFAGYMRNSPGQVRSMLDANGLTSPAAHIQLQAIRDNLAGEIEAAQTLGQKYIVVPSLPGNERTLADYHRHAETLNRAGETCKAAGLKMGYHNHDFEFAIVEGQRPYDILMEETDPELVAMELDLFWIVTAGVDPVEYINKYPGRFAMLHVKDRDAQGRMVDVGRGTIKFAELFSRVDTGGFEHYFIEHDNPGNGLVSVAYSIYTVRNLRF